MNTRLTLSYRDAANYKTSLSVVLTGSFAPEQVVAIRAKLNEGRYIIPGQVGLPNPAAQFQGKDGFPNEDLDHVWVQLNDFEDISDVNQVLSDISTEDAPTYPLTVAALAAAFARLEGWDEGKAWSEMAFEYGR